MWCPYKTLPDGHKARVKEWANKPVGEALRKEFNLDTIRKVPVEKISPRKLTIIGLDWIDNEGTAVIVKISQVKALKDYHGQKNMLADVAYFKGTYEDVLRLEDEQERQQKRQRLV